MRINLWDPMFTYYKTDAPKKPVNLTLNSELLKLAKEQGLNISGLAEEALAKAVKARLEESWLKENSEAILAYNEHVKAKGVFSDGLRSF